jgi:hypothetical protein
VRGPLKDHGKVVKCCESVMSRTKGAWEGCEILQDVTRNGRTVRTLQEICEIVVRNRQSVCEAHERFVRNP